MAKVQAPVVISANCLLTGAVLYWGADGRGARLGRGSGIRTIWMPQRLRSRL